MAEQEKMPSRVGKVVQQATVIFAGAEITAVLAEDGYVYGALPHLCRALDLDGEGQRERIEEQAEHISDLVKQTAIAMAKKLGGGNFFGTVYGQLYRMFNVTSYKLLTQAQYPKAVEWLQKQMKTYES